MTYGELRAFLENKMRMSHVYQPAMLLALLDAGGEASVERIAQELLAHDQSQVEYYSKITREMPGRVLSNHGVVEPTKSGRSTKGYCLPAFPELTDEQVDALKALCKEKISDYIEKRGAAIWDHRRNSAGYISGTLRYDVLKRAGFHCELCGIPADQKALEVDHIVPRSKGGPDALVNLQALCYSCNAMKRDRDDTDFRAIREGANQRAEGCIFCELPANRVIAYNELAYTIRDAYPVTKLHTLVIPRRHVQSYFELSQAEINATTALLKEGQENIRETDPYVTGFNVGINDGAAAGQTVGHCHVHLIPRRADDVQDPRGGIRHTIPGKGYY